MTTNPVFSVFRTVRTFSVRDQYNYHNGSFLGELDTVSSCCYSEFKENSRSTKASDAAWYVNSIHTTGVL